MITELESIEVHVQKPVSAARQINEDNKQTVNMYSLIFPYWLT